MDKLLPPGRYYIGDPCYMFKDKWNGVRGEDGTNVPGICDVILDGGEQVFEGRPFFAASTAYGDGGYLGSNGFTFGVDSGMLGAIPMELCEHECMRNALGEQADGVIIDAPRGLTCSVSGGLFSFYANGEIINIDTAGEDEDEEDDYWDEDED